MEQTKEYIGYARKNQYDENPDIYLFRATSPAEARRKVHQARHRDGGRPYTTVKIMLGLTDGIDGVRVK